MDWLLCVIVFISPIGSLITLLVVLTGVLVKR